MSAARAALALAGVLAVLLVAPASTAADTGLWPLLRGGGQVVLMRHASTDRSIGDPPGFRLDDCATQRNLSPAGREEARRVRAAFTAEGVPIGRILSSQWCRCLETARLAFGEPEPWPALNSAFRDREHAAVRTEQVRALIAEAPARGNLVIVSHQLNIRDATGVAPAEGDLIVVTPLGGGRFRVAGRLGPADLGARPARPTDP